MEHAPTTETETKWTRANGAYTVNTRDRWGREVRMTARKTDGDWHWTVFESGTGYEANGWQNRVLARGLEDTLTHAKYFAEAALERI